MWMSQLAKKTMTEEMRIGSHSDGIDTMFPPADRGHTPGSPRTLPRRRALPPPTGEYGTRLRDSGVELASPCLLSVRSIQPRQPVHDVQRELPVVVPRNVHPEGVTVGDLGRHHRRLTKHDHPPLPERERHALRAP